MKANVYRVVGVCIGAMLLAAGCGTPPPAPWITPGTCFGWSFGDNRYDGPDNTVDNMSTWSTTDGSCSGTLNSRLTVAHVPTQNYADAVAACTAIDVAFTTPIVAPSGFFPPGMFMCQ